MVDKVVFGKVKSALGGKVRVIVSGGAPLAPHVEDFCNVCLAPVLQVREREGEEGEGGEGGPPSDGRGGELPALACPFWRGPLGL